MSRRHDYSEMACQSALVSGISCQYMVPETYHSQTPWVRRYKTTVRNIVPAMHPATPCTGLLLERWRVSGRPEA